MKVLLDKMSDALYLRFSDGEIVESEEVFPGIVLDLDENNAVVAIEILQATSRLGSSELDQIEVQVA